MNQNELNLLAKLLKGDNKSITLQLAFENFMINAKLCTREQTQKYYLKLWKKLVIIFKNLGLETTNDITKITYKHIQLELSKFNYSNSSINKHTDILKTVIKYNYDIEFISVNNIYGIKKLPMDTPQISIIKDEMKIDIINYLKNLKMTNSNLRGTCFMFLFAESGVRLNELLNIKYEHLNLEENEIFLDFTKNKKSRYIYFSNTTKELFLHYLSFRNHENSYFFTSNSNKPLDRNCVYKFIEKIRSTLNINKSISPHKWRHTLATSLLDKNININQVKEILGHTELTTTKKYLHADRIKTKKDLLQVL